MAKIAAIVGVKDECSLIQSCLERLWSVGVGPILVLDDNSTDGTLAVIDRLSSRCPSPLVRRIFSPEFDQNMRVEGEVLSPFLRQHRPDWLLFIDADEFVVCANNDLPTILANTVDPVLSIERYNVPLTSDPFLPSSGIDASTFLTAHLITARESLSRELLEEGHGRRWVMHRVLPKLLCRPDHVSQYGLGWHSVSDLRGEPIAPTAAKGIIISHLPLTTLDRFIRKAENARDFLRRWGENYPGGAAWHWKRWVDLADRQLLAAEFAAQRMDDAEIKCLIAAGVVERADAVLKKSMQADACA